MLLECINTSVWNLFIIPEEDWSQSKSIEEYEVNKLKNEDGYSCFYVFVQLPGHSSKTVCRWTSHLRMRASFSKRSTAGQVNGSLSLSTILYMPQPHATQLQRRLLLGKQQSLIRRLLLSCMYVNDVCRWTWQLLLRGSFYERSTGQTAQWVNGSLSLSLYYI